MSALEKSKTKRIKFEDGPREGNIDTWWGRNNPPSVYPILKDDHIIKYHRKKSTESENFVTFRYETKEAEG